LFSPLGSMSSCRHALQICRHVLQICRHTLQIDSRAAGPLTWRMTAVFQKIALRPHHDQWHQPRHQQQSVCGDSQADLCSIQAQPQWLSVCAVRAKLSVASVWPLVQEANRRSCLQRWRRLKKRRRLKLLLGSRQQKLHPPKWWWSRRWNLRWNHPVKSSLASCPPTASSRSTAASASFFATARRLKPMEERQRPPRGKWLLRTRRCHRIAAFGRSWEVRCPGVRALCGPYSTHGCTDLSTRKHH